MTSRYRARVFTSDIQGMSQCYAFGSALATGNIRGDTAECRRRRATPPAAESVDPISLQASDECIEVALREPALGDLRHPRQNRGLRGAIEIGLDDEPSAAHVYLHRDADMKPGALEPSALQVQLG